MNIRCVNLNVLISGEGVPINWGHGWLNYIEVEEQTESPFWMP